PAIIAGQGTIGLEIFRQVPGVEAAIVPIGGAGLIVGRPFAIRTLNPGVRIFGVEPERAASFTAAMKAGSPVEIALKPTLADGLSVPKVGETAFRLARDM